MVWGGHGVPGSTDITRSMERAKPSVLHGSLCIELYQFICRIFFQNRPKSATENHGLIIASARSDFAFTEQYRWLDGSGSLDASDVICLIARAPWNGFHAMMVLLDINKHGGPRVAKDAPISRTGFAYLGRGERD